LGWKKTSSVRRRAIAHYDIVAHYDITAMH